MKARGKRWRPVGPRRATVVTATPAVGAAATTAPSKLHVIAYGPEGIVEREVSDASELPAIVSAHAVTWVDVAGHEDPVQVEALARIFAVHRLAVEDILHVQQRPKVEPYPGHLFVVMRMVHAPPDGALDSEQVSLVLGANFVLTFQEGLPGDCFGSVRERLRSPMSRLRAEGADRLFHALVDSIVDSVFPAIEALGEKIETLEAEVLGRPIEGTMNKIQDVKRALLLLRRIAYPAREATSNLYRDPNPLIHDETRIYLRDCHDHAVQILDLVETYRELSVGLSELYLASVSHRLNEVMKVLTIISTIFIPLSFIASVYGMNFDPDASPWNMPELRWAWGYPAALGLMGAVFVTLIGFFVRKGWLVGLGGRPEGEKP